MLLYHIHTYIACLNEESEDEYSKDDDNFKWEMIKQTKKWKKIIV